MNEVPQHRHPAFEDGQKMAGNGLWPLGLAGLQFQRRMTVPMTSRQGEVDGFNNTTNLNSSFSFGPPLSRFAW